MGGDLVMIRKQFKDTSSRRTSEPLNHYKNHEKCWRVPGVVRFWFSSTTGRLVNVLQAQVHRVWVTVGVVASDESVWWAAKTVKFKFWGFSESSFGFVVTKNALFR